MCITYWQWRVWAWVHDWCGRRAARADARLAALEQRFGIDSAKGKP